jgi:hypothetical protein
MNYADDATRLRLADALRSALSTAVGSVAPMAAAPIANPIDAGPDHRTRGIAFSSELVRAILAGRKTQTRRLVRPVPVTPPQAPDCKTAQPGEWLYVREPWARLDSGYRYAADRAPASGGFKPGMYMPRDAARLFLFVTEVHVHRLNDITPSDIAAEGVPPGMSFEQLWNTFFTKPGETWLDNPWVWAIHFRMKRDPPATP